MDIDLFKEILDIESTSGSERKLALFLAEKFKTEHNTVETFEVGDGTLNLLFKWGDPRVWFCTHLDTVPPYFPTTISDVEDGAVLPDGKVAASSDVLFHGRGTCDAKGQIFSMWSACKALEDKGLDGFALLLLAGEETGSFGAKAYTRDCEGGELVIVGEPTDNLMVSASKGTKSFAVKIHGEACHSGYPSHGESAIDNFVKFYNRLSETAFPVDRQLGPTTWNIGKLHSDNPQNVLSPEISFRIYFRTTFSSDKFVSELMESMNSDKIEVEAFGGDTPMRYTVISDFPSTVVAFGSDAPQLKKFAFRALCGPGSILTAHKDNEYVLLSDLETATAQYVKMFEDYTE